jgi:hypothetical protein
MSKEAAVVHGAAILLLAIVLFPALWMLQGRSAPAVTFLI